MYSSGALSSRGFTTITAVCLENVLILPSRNPEPQTLAPLPHHPGPLAATLLLPVSSDPTAPGGYVSGASQHLSSCAGLTSSGPRSPRSLCGGSSRDLLLVQARRRPACVSACEPRCASLSSVGGHSGCFHLSIRTLTFPPRCAATSVLRKLRVFRLKTEQLRGELFTSR